MWQAQPELTNLLPVLLLLPSSGVQLFEGETWASPSHSVTTNCQLSASLDFIPYVFLLSIPTDTPVQELYLCQRRSSMHPLAHSFIRQVLTEYLLCARHWCLRYIQCIKKKSLPYRRPKQAFPQRRHTVGQETHEKMLYITNY